MSTSLKQLRDEGFELKITGRKEVVEGMVPAYLKGDVVELRIYPTSELEPEGDNINYSLLIRTRELADPIPR